MFDDGPEAVKQHTKTHAGNQKVKLPSNRSFVALRNQRPARLKENPIAVGATPDCLAIRVEVRR